MITARVVQECVMGCGTVVRHEHLASTGGWASAHLENMDVVWEHAVLPLDPAGQRVLQLVDDLRFADHGTQPCIVRHLRCPPNDQGLRVQSSASTLLRLFRGMQLRIGRRKVAHLLGGICQERDQHVEQHDSDHEEEQAQQRRSRQREVRLQRTNER